MGLIALALTCLLALLAADRMVLGEGPGEQRQTTLLFRIPEHDLYPESIAFDEVSGDYFLSSMGSKRILRIHPDGSYEDFLAAPVAGLASSIGMKVDAGRRSLWVCTGRFSLLADFDATPARTGVLRLDIDTGRLLDSWLLPEEQAGPYSIFNDLAITAAGDAFATTTLLGALYRLRPGVETMEVIQQLPEGSNNNGVTLGPEGRYLFVTVDRRIHRIDPGTGESVPIDVPGDGALGTDGLYYYDGSLIVVKPRFRQVARLFLDDALDGVDRVEVLVDNDPDLAYPTTGVIVDDTLIFVATSYADTPRSSSTAAQHGDVLIKRVTLR